MRTIDCSGVAFMQNRNDWIQALRGIAALMVVFFHLAPHWALDSLLKTTESLTRWGFSGVDIFFVLSGYVVYQSADKKHFLLPSFMLRRAMRIYLGYWPVFLLLFGLAFLGEPLPDAQKIMTSALLLNPVLWDNWLPTAWSLTYELYFYVWIAIICSVRWLPKSGTIGIFCAILLAWNIGWYVFDPVRVQAGLQPLRFPLTGMGLEFLAGAAWAHSRRRFQILQTQPWPLMALGLILVMIGFSIGTTSQFFDRVEILRVGSYGFAGFGFLLMALSMGDLHWRAPHCLTAVGDASYSLYLLHPILLTVFGTLRFRTIAPDSPWLLPFLLGMPMAMVLISLLWFRWVEKPVFDAIANRGSLHHRAVEPMVPRSKQSL